MRKLSDGAKVKILALGLLILLAIALIAGVVVKSHRSALNRAEGESMLIVIGRGNANGTSYTIVYDVETGVEYALTDSGLFPLYTQYGGLKIK